MYDNVISVYTRQQAIEDGVFTDITEVAKDMGFKTPVAITTNLYGRHIRTEDTQGNMDKAETTRKLIATLNNLKGAILTQTEPDSMIAFKVIYDGKFVDVWAVIEAQSPTDPSPAMNILLPEDY